MKSLHRIVLLTSALCLPLTLSTGCGGGDDDDNGADAAVGIDAAGAPDAAATACPEFDTPAGSIDGVPGSYTGDTAGAGADLEVGQGVCTDERSYYSQAGDDQVVAVSGLTAGTEYVARVRSAADLAFYVATGCDGAAAGPVAGDCVLFVDEAGGREVGGFTAPADGEVFIVVDQFGTDPVADATYQLDLYEPECSDTPACDTGSDNICFERLCVACVTSFDCADGAAPACNADNECVTGFDSCTGDDAAENGDDGPAGATALSAPTAGAPTTVAGAICSAPSAEADYFSFTVAEGDNRTLVLDWAGTEDLDLILFDADGNDVEFSFFDHPEVVRADGLAAGTYYVSVSQFTPADTPAAAAYTLSLGIPECDSSYDCADAAKPVCDATSTCVTGSADCTGDDAREDSDDGPAGATDATPAIDATTTMTGKLCNTPATERDFFAVTTAAGDNVTVELSWTDAAADLDVATALADGSTTGFTFWQNPENVTLTNLPAGTHYIELSYFGPAVTAAVDYTLKVTRTAGGCTTAADCATVYETQLLRGACNASACEFIAGDGAIANGELCDSPDDCSSGRCSYAPFESDADESLCTVECVSDADCDTALGAGTKCTTPFSTNFCHPACTTNTDCGANTNSDTLDTDLPWDYLTCNAGTCDL